ncbi:MAG: DNA replication/repair protein RecF [Mariprofundaceae bacterium]
MSDVPELYLQKIEVDSLRCFQKSLWEFTPGLSLITGANGCGKTTLLEAVSILAHGRSFRSLRDPQLIRWGTEEFYISGSWLRFGQLHTEARGRQGRVELKLQGHQVQSSDLNEALPVIIEAPQARRLIDGTARERRRWLDSLLIVCQDTYSSRYKNYLRCLTQWQRLRRQNQSTSGEIEVWEEQMVAYGLEVTQIRDQIIEEINVLISELTDLVEGELTLSLKKTAPDDAKSWRSLLKNYRVDRGNTGRLHLGPHCDRPDIVYRGKEIRHTGSRGQQRLAAIAIRLAEWDLRKQKRGVAPLLMFDDCLEPLDQGRQEKIMKHLQSTKAQILLTTPAGSSMTFNSAVQVQSLDQSANRKKVFPVTRAAISMKEAA